MTSNNYESGERQAALRRRADPAAPETKTPEHPLLTLQSQIGNAQVARLLSQRAAEDEEEIAAKHDVSLQRAADDEEEIAAKHDTSLQRAADDEEDIAATHDVSLQRAADDEEEIAASHDLSLQRAADDEEQIAASHDLSLQRAADDEEEIAATHDTSLQRAADDEEEIAASHDLSLQRAADDEEDIAAKHDTSEHVGIGGGPVGPDTAQRIQSSRGGGSSLDGATRSSMEAGFGTSFEDVRVHQDSESDTLTRRLTAHAFTTGNDIYLRGDANPSDNRLMAHELTHVVQQRTMSGGSGMSVGAAGDSHEHDADAAADAVLSGQTQRNTEDADQSG